MNQYIGIPFVPGGREPSGWDCWGCVQWIARHEFGIDMPDYPLCVNGSGVDLRQAARLMDEGRASFRAVDIPGPGDVILLYGRKALRRFAVHAGLMVGKSDFIHCMQPVGTMIESADGPIWKGRVEGFYRYV